MATPSSAAMIMDSIAMQPLGSLNDEAHLRSPHNRGTENVLVRVRNLSAVKSRRYFHEDRPSWLRGGEQLEKEIKKRYPTFDLSTARRDAFVGGGVTLENIVKEGIKPVDAVVTFDNEKYKIPYKDEQGNNAPWIDVPEGVYDLYFGNFARLNSSDPRERSNEMEAVKNRRGNLDKNVVIRPGEANPWAFLEFERRVIKPETFAIDVEQVYADRLMEI
jgi:hypothetical protein